MSLLTYPWSEILQLSYLPTQSIDLLFHIRPCVIALLLAHPKYHSLQCKPSPLIRSGARPRKHSRTTTMCPRSSINLSPAANYSMRNSTKLAPCSWTGEWPSRKQKARPLRLRQRPSVQPQTTVMNGQQYESVCTPRLPILFPTHQ